MLFVNIVNAQTSEINPERIVVGNDVKALLPTWSSAATERSALVIWNDGSRDRWDKPLPMLGIVSPYGGVWTGISNDHNSFGSLEAGDYITQISGGILGESTKRMIINLNTESEYNTRKYHIGTQQRDYKTFVVSNSDRVGIGTDNFPSSFPEVGGDNYRLYVKGGIKAEEVKVELCSSSGWCDYVFAPKYKLMRLSALKKYITTNKHLPNMPSAQQLVDDGGFEVSKMITMQQEKIEENTLYILQLNDRMQQLQKENEELKKRLTSIETLIQKSK